MKILQQVSPMLSFPEMNLTSNLPCGQLEYALLLLLSLSLSLSPVSLQQVSLVQLTFEMIDSPLDLAHAVVKSAFFESPHLQDPSLQCSPLNQNRNASVIGHGTFRY